MAYVKCHACGAEAPHDAGVCPQCGKPIQSGTAQDGGTVAGVFFGSMIGVIGLTLLDFLLCGWWPSLRWVLLPWTVWCCIAWTFRQKGAFNVIFIGGLSCFSLYQLGGAFVWGSPSEGNGRPTTSVLPEAPDATIRGYFGAIEAGDVEEVCRYISPLVLQSTSTSSAHVFGFGTRPQIQSEFSMAAYKVTNLTILSRTGSEGCPQFLVSYNLRIGPKGDSVMLGGGDGEEILEELTLLRVTTGTSTCYLVQERSSRGRARAPVPPPGPQAPSWYTRLGADRRPAPPLRQGLRFGQGEGEYVHDRTGVVLVYVPPGVFRMGTASGWDDHERPVHEVRFARGFYLGKYELTWGQYRAFCQATSRQAPSNVIESRRGPRFEAGDDHPVFNVSWNDAQAYCQWAGLRLPSEAEWEYAARGTDGRTYPWGNEEPGTAHCNLSGSTAGHQFTAPVGSFPGGASPFGAMDMAGNVFECVQDTYQSSYQNAPGDGRAWEVAGASDRVVVRGGSWNVGAGMCRAANRLDKTPGVAIGYLGFRVAGDP